MKRGKILIPSLIAVSIIIVVISLCIGSYPLSVQELLNIVIGKIKGTISSGVFWQLRFPRVIMGFVAGASLGLAGGVYQTVFRNNLASPDITGVASGASFGAALAIVLGAGTSFQIMSGSFIAGLLSLAFVLLLVRLSGMEKTGSYILAGIIVSSVASAGVMLLKVMADPEKELAAIEFWTMGSLSAMTDDKLFPQIVFIILSTVLLLLFSKQIVMLSLGGSQAKSLGLSPSLWRFILLGLSTLAVSSAVSVMGAVSFIGLIAPHIAFNLYKRRNGTYFCLCALMGGIVLSVADIFARSLAHGAELPLSIFTVLFSVPFLVILLLRRKGGRATK